MKSFLSRPVRSLVLTGAFLMLAGVTTTAALQAQTTGEKGGPNKGSPSAKKERKVHLKADQFSRETTPQGLIQTGWGSVVITSEDTILKTAQAVYNDTTKIASSPGKLQIDDSQNTINGDTGTAFYKTRDAIITGKNVVMILRPKPEDKNAPEGSARREFKSPAKITCTKVEYNWRTHIAIATGNLTINYEDQTVTAERAIYHGNEEFIQLEGTVRYGKKNGDVAAAVKAYVSLKEGQEKFYAAGDMKNGSKTQQVSGTFDVSKGDPEDDAPIPPAPPIPTVGSSPTGTPAAQPTPPSVPTGPAPALPTPPPAAPETPPTGPTKTTGEGTTPANPPATPPATTPETTPPATKP